MEFPIILADYEKFWINVFQTDRLEWSDRLAARSPDLNVLDYFVWGYVKAAVEHKRDDIQNEVHEIIAVFHTRQISRRVELYLQVQERHFE